MMKKFSTHAFLYVLLAFLWSFTACKNDKKTVQHLPKSNSEHSGSSSSNPKSGKQIPAYVLTTLQYIRQHDAPPDGYVGGRDFQNREKKLPAKTPDGTKIRYREWDVHPKERGVNRGAERLVTGNDQSVWYTNDHYKRFVRVE